MFLDHRPSFVSFKKGLYLTRSSICLKAAALGKSVAWESFLALVAFCWRFHLEAWQFLESSVCRETWGLILTRKTQMSLKIGAWAHARKMKVISSGISFMGTRAGFPSPASFL